MIDKVKRLYQKTAMVKALYQQKEKGDVMKDSYNTINDARDDFMKQCTACGGNWTGMLWSGVREVFPEFYQTFPEGTKVSFPWLAEVITVLLSQRYGFECERTIVDLMRDDNLMNMIM